MIPKTHTKGFEFFGLVSVYPYVSITRPHKILALTQTWKIKFLYLSMNAIYEKFSPELDMFKYMFTLMLASQTINPAQRK